MGAGWGDVAKRSASEPQPAPMSFDYRTTERQRTKNATEVAFLKSSQFRSLDLGFGAQTFLEAGQLLLLQLLSDLGFDVVQFG